MGIGYPGGNSKKGFDAQTGRSVVQNPPSTGLLGFRGRTNQLLAGAHQAEGGRKQAKKRLIKWQLEGIDTEFQEERD